MTHAAGFVLALLAMGVSIQAAPSAHSRKPPDPTEGMFSLAGQNGLPPGFKATPQALADAEGLRGGEVRTTDTDFIDRDFTLDLLFKFHDQDHGGFVIGIGQNEPTDRGIAYSVLSHVFSPANGARATLLISGQPETELGKLPETGPNLFRVQKKGNTLTFAIVPKYDGTFRPTIIKTIVDLRTAALFLNRTNSALFFSGDATFEAVRLVASGAAATPATTKPAERASEPDPIDREPFFSLAGQASLPSYLRAGPRTYADPDGLHTMDAGTIDTDFIDKDFTLDVEVQFKETQRSVALIALGEMDQMMIGAHVQSPSVGSGATVVISGQPESPFGGIGPNPRPRFFRFQRRGDTLTFSLSFDPDQKKEPTVVRTIPDLKTIVPFLNRSNSRLILAGDCAFVAVRLAVNGKPLDPHRSDAARERSLPAQAFFNLAGIAGIPQYLRASGEALADADGLRSHELRTASTDLLDHNFTLDLLFRFRDERERAAFRADVGGVGVMVNSPGAGGGANLHIPGQAPIELGLFDTIVRDGFLRMEKRGPTLTLSLVPAYQGELEPLITRTIPDLKTADPSLTRLNSGAVISGDCTWRAVRLWLDGKPQASGLPATRPGQGPEPTARFIRLSRDHFPDFLTPDTDLTFDDYGLTTAGKIFHTVTPGYIDQDFTFDVVYRFAPGERAILFVGLGEGRPEGIWCANSVGSRVHGPGFGGDPSPDGAITITVSGQGEGELTKFGTRPGPHLLRLRKRGNRLTFSARADFDGHTTPDAVKTVPDLRAVLPALDAKNSYLFFGGGGTVEQVRLVVDDQPIEVPALAAKLPERTLAGRPLRLQLVQDARGRQFSLESAPRGMSISPTGLVQWTPADNQTGTWRFRIVGQGPEGREYAPAKIEVAPEQPTGTKVDASHNRSIPEGPIAISPGLDRSVLLLQGNEVRRLAADGSTVSQVLQLPRAYSLICERADYFLAISTESKTLDLVDKTTLQVRRGIQMDYPSVSGLGANPGKPVCYVAVEKPASVPPHAVLVVDESSGDVFEPPDLIGQWVCVSPDGGMLYTADVSSPSNPALPLHRPHPELPANDLLIEYDSAGTLPKQGPIKEGAAGTVVGLSLSPDGRRLAVLSQTGYPPGSGNLPAWDPRDLVKRPVSYSSKAHSARCDRIAFHPTLPIVAMPTASAAVCFGRETGIAQPDRLDLTRLPHAAKVEDLFFSPDGRNLVLVCASGSARLLCTVPLKLNPAEEAALQKPQTAPAPPAAPARR